MPTAGTNNPNAGGLGFVALPTQAPYLTTACRAVWVTTAGNLGLVLADGTNNDAQLVAVTASQFFPVQAIGLSPSNTAVVIGVL